MPARKFLVAALLAATSCVSRAQDRVVAPNASITLPPSTVPAQADVAPPVDMGGGGGITAVDLATVMRLAAGRNLDTRIVREAAREAEAKVRQADWRFLPTVRPGVRFQTVDGNVQATEGDILDVDKQNAFGGVSLVLEWNLSEAVFQRLSARQRQGARCAQASAEAGRAALRAAELYLDMQRAQSAIEVARQSVALYENLAEQRQAQAELGGGFQGEVLGARARRAHAQVALRRAEEAYDVAAAALREVLDLPESVRLAPAEATVAPLSLVTAELPEAELARAAIAARPEVRASQFETGAAREDWRQARIGPLLPDVRAGYEVGGFGRDFGSLGDTENFGVALEWKIGPGGLFDQPAQDAAAARLRAAQLGVARTRGQVAREVGQARAQILATTAAIHAAEQGVDDAARAHSLFEERQKSGVGSALEAVLSEETLTQARLDYLDAAIRHNKAQVRLLYAVGRLR